MPAGATAPQIIEGTWEEISRQGAKLNGHRVRVEILPDEINKASTGRYAARMRPLLEEAAAVSPTTEEREQAEREVQQLKDALNENRRLDGAEPIF